MANVMMFIIVISVMAVLAMIVFTMISIWKDNNNNNKDALEEDRRTKNDLYELYLKIDPDEFRNKIDNLIDFHISEYALYHFAANDTYITGDMTEEMINDIVKTVYINLSPLYTFYIRMIINVVSNEDILGYINNRTKTRVLLYITELNKPR